MAETTIRSHALSATIAHHGAELQSLKDNHGRELMSSGDPAFWRGRAPLLFPIVGRLNHDTLRTGGRSYEMGKHGFARSSHFTPISATADEAMFRLSDSEATRKHYPFAFILEMHFRLVDATLHMAATVRNPAPTPLPFSFGFHPAFAWPLPYGGVKADHRIVFEKKEPQSLARITPYGTIAPDPVASPVTGDSFTLDDRLFANDALVWPTLASHRLRYGVAGFPALDIAFPDTHMLGIWTKPGAAFVCVEPWAGIADPEGFDGQFDAKPGIILLPPGAAQSFRMDIAVSG